MKEEKRDYYVYLHKRKDNGEVFYVGKGTGHRITIKYGRNKLWNEITKSCSWYAEKYKEDLTEDEALALELHLIHEINPVANVHRKDIRKKTIDSDFANRRYRYDENSPTGLVYNEWNGQFGNKRREIGDVAGRLNNNGYYIVNCGKSGAILAHRVVWLLVNKEDPLLDVVDHLDGNRENNSISNLRKIPPKDNAKNLSMRKDNTTGMVGVNRTSSGYYMATWPNNGISQSKLFSIAKYGKDLAFELACYARLENVSKDFSDRHIGSLEFKILSSFSEEDIQAILVDDSLSNNSTGIRNIHRHLACGIVYWRFRYGNKVSANFSEKKFGENIAKQLAIETKSRFFGGEMKSVTGLSLDETNKIIKSACHKWEA